MKFVERMTSAIRLWYHKREIESSARHYQERTGRDARRRQSFSESGSFQFQLHRLFSVGTAEETRALKNIASAAVNICLSNKYYRPADFLSDIVEALENTTYLSTEPGGEAPLGALDSHQRKLKIEQVVRSWLVPVKVAALESILASFADEKDRSLPYRALGHLERQAARLFTLVEEAEVRLVEKRLLEFLRSWKTDTRLRERYPEPANGLEDVVGCLRGDTRPEGTDGLRVRRPGQPFRMATVVPEDRQHLLYASLERLR